jgi:hypothetical protein
VTWTATDSSGNTATATQRVVVVDTLDSIKPVISITSPAANATISGTPKAVRLTITGTAADSQSDIALVEVGTAPDNPLYIPATPIAPGDWSSWTADLYIRTDGPERLVAKATDLFGNIQMTSVPINVTFAPSVDVGNSVS